MRTIVTPAAVLACVCAGLFALAACGPGAGLSAVGTSDVPRAAESRAVSPVSSSTGQWPHWLALDPKNLESRGFTRIEATPVASKGHHPPSWKGIVSVDNDAAPLYRALRPGVSLPEGTVIAESHTLASGQAGPVFAMAKTAGVWTYSVVSPEGRIEEPGEIATCARCHGESPHDAVFGPRTPLRESPGEVDRDEGLAPPDSEGPAGKSRSPGKKRRR